MERGIDVKRACLVQPRKKFVCYLLIPNLAIQDKKTGWGRGVKDMLFRKKH